MDKELISVVIPTYKRFDVLSRAIDSALNQTYTNIEIIVIDDNKKDSQYRKKTEEVMKKYEKNSKIRYLKNEKNLGGAETRNVGIKASKGEFIAFLDDDDEFVKDKIEKQLKYYKQLNSDKIGLIYCYTEIRSEDGNDSIVVKKDFEGNQLYNHMLYFIATTSTWLCKKRVLEDIGGFEDVPSNQDATVLLNLLSKGYEVYRVPEVLLILYGHDQSNNGISGYTKKNLESFKLYRDKCRKQYKLLKDGENSNKIEYEFHRRLLNYYIRDRKFKEAFKELKGMFETDFLKISNLKNLVKIILYAIFYKGELR